MLLSFIFYKVGITKLDAVILILSFTGVVIMMLGSFDKGDKQKSLEEEELNLIIPIIMLFFVPFLMASNMMLLRQMRDLHEYTISSYISLSMIIIYWPLIWAMGLDLSFVYSFGLAEWLIVIAISFTSVFVQICRIKSVQYEEPARTAVINYF